MKSAEEILSEFEVKNHITLNKTNRKWILDAMIAYSNELNHFVQERNVEIMKKKIINETWAAFVQFEPYIESENAIEDLRTMHEKFCVERRYSKNQNKK